MHRITLAEVEHIAFKIAQERFAFDEPIPSFTTRYPNILESCLLTPFQTFAGKTLYRTFISKVSMLFYLINKNHPFQNGNKRIAMTTLLCMLYINKKWLKVDSKTLYNFAIFVAASPSPAKKEVVQYIEKFIKKHIVSRD